MGTAAQSNGRRTPKLHLSPLTNRSSNRNNTAFKIRRNSMKLNGEPNSNRNTNQDIAAVAASDSICNNDSLPPRES